jgi:hypothetical protein
VTPSFDNDQDTSQRRDWELLQNGFVTLFWRKSLFAETKATLLELGYSVVELDAGEWLTTEEALAAFGRALHFPDYYGMNVNALADCLSDVATFDYGSDPKSAGTVIALDRYDAFIEHDPQLGWTLLDILADTGRQALLIGHRFIVVVRSEDPVLSLPAVGGTPVMWNRTEFMRSRRG